MGDRRRRTAVDGAAPPPAARDRRRRGRGGHRPGVAVRGMAALVRADRRARRRRPRVRGRPVGRRWAARLHRPHPRLVARAPHLHHHVGPAELLDRRRDWGAGRRNFTSLVLEPLDPDQMRELLAGLVPGLPATVVDRVLERAEGIPLYAVETVRMLLADGLVALEGSVYRPTGDLSQLSVPASLHALIASRLDGLDPADRSLLQGASVIGKTFTLDALAAVSGVQPDDLVPRLRALVRREMLTLEADPRSPERGQYGFVQGLVREVAYGTLAKRDRRRMHVAAARYFESLDDEGIAGALAEHYVAAYKAQPDGAEGSAVAAQARVALRAAAERARSLGSYVQAMRFLEEALDVTTDPVEEAQLHAAAGEAGINAGLIDEPIAHMARALELARASKDRPGLMAAIVRYAKAINMSGRTA